MLAPPPACCLSRLPAAALLARTHQHHYQQQQQQQQQRLLAGPAAAAAASSSPLPPAAAAVTAAGDEQQQPLPHVSVLLQEVLHNLNHMPIKVYVDCTLGAGGHMAAMLGAHPELVAAVGLDVDPTAHSLAAARLARQAAARGGGGQPALHLLRGNYSDVVPLLSGVPGGSLVGRVDAMLMDLGVSSMQLDTPSRGFSFSADGPIDMRLDPDATASAEELVNCASEAELGRILREYGEEKSWRAVARRIVAAREAAPITTTRQLVAVVGQTQLRGSGGGRRARGGGIHPATRTFQALRIAVNDEIRRLEAALPAALSCLSPGGRLAVISFHSLEDRLVKHAFNAAAGRPTPEQEALVAGPHGAEVLDALRVGALGSLVSRKPVIPGASEVAANPRSRSAKLRVFERAGGPASAAAAAGRHGRSKARRRDSGGDVSAARGGGDGDSI